MTGSVRPLRNLPPRIGGRVSRYEDAAQQVLALPPDRYLELPARDAAEALVICRRISKLVRDRGVGVRTRVTNSAACIWLDEDLHPVRRKKHIPPQGANR